MHTVDQLDLAFLLLACSRHPRLRKILTRGLRDEERYLDFEI